MEQELLILPTEEEMKQIKEHLLLDSEKLEHSYNLLLNWISYQKHLPQNMMSKNALQYFLIACNLNLDKTKKKIERFCYVPVVHGEFVENRIVSTDGDLKCLEYAYVLPFPKLTPDGSRITVIRYSGPKDFEPMEMYRYVAMMCDYRVHHEILISGETIIFDMALLKPNHYARIFTKTLIDFLKIGLLTYPCKVKQVFVVNCHPLLEKGVSLIKSVMTEKIRNRINFVQNSSDLCKHIPKEYLPSDYCGSQKSLDELREGWLKLMLTQKEFFAKLSKFKPIGPLPKHLNGMCRDEFGVEGSFRKLNID